jgi:hypothetical protein
MGTGGATALLSPECGTALAVSLLSQRRKRGAESLGTDRRLTQTPYNSFSKEHDFQSAIANRKSEFFWFSGIYIQEFISADGQPTLQSSSFVLCDHLIFSVHRRPHCAGDG